MSVQMQESGEKLVFYVKKKTKKRQTRLLFCTFHFPIFVKRKTFLAIHIYVQFCWYDIQQHVLLSLKYAK